LAAFKIQPHEQHDPHRRLYECLFNKNLGPTVGTSFQFHRFPLGSYERGWNMRKLSLVLAALATIAIAAPTVASAEDFGVGVRIGGDRDRGGFRDRDDFRGARAEFRDHDRGFHRGWDRDRGDRTVIIKQRRHRDWD
jgi:hypothetical protein